MIKNQKIRIFSIVLILTMLVGALGMPTNLVQAAGITLDGAVSSNTAGSGSSITVNHTTGTGADRLMLVGISWNCGTTNRTISSVTFTPGGGSAINLTEVITQLGYNATNPRYSAIYRLLDPPSGQAGTVTINFSGSVSNGIMAGVANFAGVNQTTPLGTPIGANANNTTPSVTLTGLSGDELVFDNVFLGAGSSTYSLTVGPDQTQLWNPAYVANLRAAASTEQATSSSVTMSWTASTANYWAITAVPIKPAPAGPTHILTIATAGNGSGTVDPSVGEHTYPENDPVTLHATADPGSTFDGWSGDADCTDGSVTMDADKTCTATFTAIEYTLSVISDHGTVTKNPNQATYHYGAVVQLTAAPASGYIFTDWTGDLTSSANPAQITMDGNKSVTANYLDTAGLVIVDGAPVSDMADPTDSSISFDFTTGTGTNRLMLVGVSWNCGTTNRTVSSATFTPDGDSAIDLDEVITQQYNWSTNNYRYTAIYSLLGPPSGVSGTVDIGFSGAVSNGIIAGAASFANVNQTDPLGTPDGAVGTGNNSSGTPNPSVTLTELAGNELVFDSVFIGVSSTSHAISADSGQSELWNISGYPSSSSFNTLGAASTRQATGASAIMSWTTANYGSTATRWSIAAVPINPAPVATEHTVTFNANGGTGSMTPQVANVPTALTTNAFTRTDYSFSGWNTAANGTGTAYANGATYSFAADITLYAQWTANFTVTSTATPSDGAPDIGDTITVDINININGAALGSYTGSLEWDPAILNYLSYSGAPPSGFTGNVITTNAASGQISFNGINASGPTGNIAIITITFSVVGSGTSALDLAYSAMATAGTFTDLLPELTITDGQVVVPAGADHTVTFNANNGTGTMAPQVANVPTALTLNSFTRTGYSFSGWNTLANGSGTAYANGATYPFTADATLYAQWSALPNHTVTFNANNGTGTMAPQVANVPTALTTNAFTRSGYNFTGWNTLANGTGTAYANGATYSFAADITLYAQWSALPNHTVTFNANNGTGTMAPQVANVPTALTTNAFTRSGYNFTGWNTLANGTGTAYANGATYSFAADITLYAQWTLAPTITVTSAATPSDGAPDIGDTITVNININISGAALGSFTGSLDWNPAILSYSSNSGLLGGFSGAVNTGSTGTGHIAFNGANATGTTGNTIIFTITFSVVGAGTSALDLAYSSMAAASTFENLLPSLTITDGQVVVPPPSHTVTFNANGGTGTMSPQTANTATALTLNTFTRAGYSFSGWGTSVGGPVVYANGAVYSFSADITLYAQWTALPNHTVTFNANGGTGTMTPQSANVPTALTANTFTHTGYNFSGWGTSVGGPVVYVDGAIYDFDADITLYAQWIALGSHTVTFNANGGSGTMSNQVANVPTALTLNTFTFAGFSFSSWNTVANGTGTAYADGAIYSFEADITLYAQWTALPNHTVIFDSNGGTGTMSNQVANLPTALAANAFVRTGYSFSGWGTSASGPVVYADGAIYDFDANITLYAQWTVITKFNYFLPIVQNSGSS